MGLAGGKLLFDADPKRDALASGSIPRFCDFRSVRQARFPNLFLATCAEVQERIWRAKAILPVNFSGSVTWRPVSSRVNFNLPPPTNRTLPIFFGQFSEVVDNDLMVTFPSAGISRTMA